MKIKNTQFVKKNNEIMKKICDRWIFIGKKHSDHYINLLNIKLPFSNLTEKPVSSTKISFPVLTALYSVVCTL